MKSFLVNFYRYLEIFIVTLLEFCCLLFGQAVADQDMLAPDLLPHPTPDFLGKVGSNLALGLVSSCCGNKTVCWRPACCWLR